LRRQRLIGPYVVEASVEHAVDLLAASSLPAARSGGSPGTEWPLGTLTASCSPRA
jgi:hypothetical protein